MILASLKFQGFQIYTNAPKSSQTEWCHNTMSHRPHIQVSCRISRLARPSSNWSSCQSLRHFQKSSLSNCEIESTYTPTTRISHSLTQVWSMSTLEVDFRESGPTIFYIKGFNSNITDILYCVHVKRHRQPLLWKQTTFLLPSKLSRQPMQMTNIYILCY